MSLELSWDDWLALLTHFMTLSMLAVGGAISTTPDMHRFLVNEKLWLSESQFTSSVAIAQAAPGPNVMFVALLGYSVGLNAGSYGYAALGVLIAIVGIMLPSSTLAYVAARWGQRNRELRSVRAFKQGMAPMIVALLVATGWVLSSGHTDLRRDWPVWLLTGVSTLLVWRTRLHLLWLLAAGGLLGAVGWL